MKALFISLLFFVCINVHAQKNTQAEMIGSWKVSEIKMLYKQDEKDSIRIMEEAKDAVIVFLDHNRFITYKKNGNEKEELDSGSYRISDDGKTLEQNGEEVKILSLNDKEMVMEIDNTIVVTLRKIKAAELK